MTEILLFWAKLNPSKTTLFVAIVNDTPENVALLPVSFIGFVILILLTPTPVKSPSNTNSSEVTLDNKSPVLLK